MPGTADSEAKRLAVQLRGELQRDSQTLATRLLGELFGADTVSPPEAEYLDFVVARLGDDPAFPMQLYKEKGARGFVGTVAAATGMHVNELRQQAKAAHAARALQAQLAPPPPATVPGAPPPDDALFTPPLPPEVPEIEGVPV